MMPRRAPAQTLLLRLILPLLLPLLLAACAPLDEILPDRSGDETVGSVGTADVADPSDGVDPVAAAEAAGITIDRVNMADFPCHGMSDTIMGDCSDEDIARVTAELLDNRAKKAAKATDGDSEGGSGSGQADTASGEKRPGATAGLDPDLVSRLESENITVDLEAMAELPCHAMFEIIMGDCSQADVERIASQVRAQRLAAGGGGSPVIQAGFQPGDADPDLLPVPRRESSILDLADGARFDLTAELITWDVGGETIRGYGYNGMVPGPLIHVQQGSTIWVDFHNRIDLPTTVHWHGLRHDSAYDGVPGVTQAVVNPGGDFEYKLYFPDAGPYWYHPHVREDIQQDAGMSGMMLVDPKLDRYYNPVDQEHTLVLDDILIEEDGPVAFGAEHANFAVMGRFGNVMLVNGETDYRLKVNQGDVVRFHIANVSNARPYNVSFDGARMRKVGSDMGKYVIERFVDSFIIAPAERYTVEVLFDEARDYRIQNLTPKRDYALGRVLVQRAKDGRAVTEASANAKTFDRSRLNTEVWQDVEPFLDYLDRPPDAELVIDVDMPGLIASEKPAESDPDHADPKAGGDHADDEAGDGHGRIEWEDDMLAANRLSRGGEDVRWIIRDKASGAENHELAYAYKVGDIVKMRWYNDPNSPHPMQHPIHIHGQRFLVLAIDGEPNEDLVWKDTFLMPIGATVDLVLEVTNPGAWMVHCHIAEHLETGMMYQFIVTE
jgi:FtsP/CotA-like multicopper oxidase with cupredoxin domain